MKYICVQDDCTNLHMHIKINLDNSQPDERKPDFNLQEQEQTDETLM